MTAEVVSSSQADTSELTEVGLIMSSNRVIAHAQRLGSSLVRTANRNESRMLAERLAYSARELYQVPILSLECSRDLKITESIKRAREFASLHHSRKGLVVIKNIDPFASVDLESTRQRPSTHRTPIEMGALALADFIDLPSTERPYLCAFTTLDGEPALFKRFNIILEAGHDNPSLSLGSQGNNPARISIPDSLPGCTL